MKFQANDSRAVVVDKNGAREMIERATNASARREIAEEIVAKWPNYANPVDAIEAALRDRDERAAKIAENHRDTAYRLEEAATERRDRVIAASRASLARSIAAAIRGSKD